MKITDEEHAALALKAVKALDGVSINEKIAVLKTAVALVENSMNAEISAQVLLHHLSKD